MRYAIALQHEFIALYEGREGDIWRRVEGVDIMGLDAAKLVEKAQSVGTKWRSLSEEIDIWFPEDVLLTGTISNDSKDLDFVETVEQSIGKDGGEILFAVDVGHDTNGRTAISAILRSDLSEGLSFVEHFGFIVKAIGSAKTTDNVDNVNIHPPTDFRPGAEIYALTAKTVTIDAIAPVETTVRVDETERQLATLAMLIGIEQDIPLASPVATNLTTEINFSPLTENPLAPIPSFLIKYSPADDYESEATAPPAQEQALSKPKSANQGLFKWLVASTLLAGALLGGLDFASNAEREQLPELPVIVAEIAIDNETLAQIYEQTDPLIKPVETPPEPIETPDVVEEPIVDEPAPEPEPEPEPEPIPEPAPEPEPAPAPESPPPTSIAPENTAVIAPEIDAPVPAERPEDLVEEVINVTDQDAGERPDFEPFEFVARPENFVSPTDAPAVEVEIEDVAVPAETPVEATPNQPTLAMARPSARDNDAIARQASQVEAEAISAAAVDILEETQVATAEPQPTQAPTEAQASSQELSAEEQEMELDRLNDDASGPSSPIGTGAAAGEATMPNAVDLSEIVLLGISGRADDPVASILKPNGEELRVKRGSLIDDWKVVAINREQVVISRGGDTRTLRTPKF